MNPVPSLSEDDLTPLLQAIASRSLDTCLRGARGLAVLGDPRAFGLLLQLSREADPAARAEVCRALAALDDPRAADRLRSVLYDPDATVRDAAFTALAKLQANTVLQYAGAGLNAGFEDVRRRGLEALVRFLRQSPQDATMAGLALELLARALNDSAPGVRGEAFKSALNLQVSGGGVQTLRYILQSIHAGVRREALTEVMAQEKEPWAWALLLEFFNDPDPKLREEAFAFAIRKNKELPPLESALLAQYPDVRQLAVDALIKKHTKPAQALLVKAVADGDKDVRHRALGALVGEDAQEPLAEALASPHADVRVRAGRALARHGDAAALAPLLTLATEAEPAQAERKADWLALAESALEGLAELGDPRAMVQLLPLLQSEQPSIRKLAARALAWTALPHHQETLRQALQHADPQVRYQAALGLAYAGDPLVAALFFSDAAGQVLTRDEQFVAAFTLGPSGEDRLAQFLDDADESLRTRALNLLLLLEMTAHQGAPVRCLTCLAARAPRARLAAARALERFADPAAFRAYVVERINDRGDEPAGKIAAGTIDTLGQVLVHGSPEARARTAYLLHLVSEKESARWEQAWDLHISRFAWEIEALREQAKERIPVAFLYSEEQLRELAFGAYVGLIREQGASIVAGYGSEPQVVRIRQTALSRVQEMAVTTGQQAAARSVLIQALGDPNQAVRLQAFDQLAALGMAADVLGAAALGAGHTDVGVRGLEKMAGGGTSAEGQAVLEEALKTRTDDLAIEAAKLLAARRGLVPVAGLALAAVHEPLRRQAVDWLAAEYDKVPQARELLRQALQSRHRKVVVAAALALAVKHDPAAFEALVKLLRETREEGQQRRLIAALADLGDPRAADAFLDRIEHDPEGNAVVADLFAAAGAMRRPETVDRLLAMSDKWPDALRQAYVVSGFDQEIQDPEDERSDRRWEEKQFPRFPGILARVLRRAIELKRNDLVLEHLPAARWARGNEVDAVLAQLAVHADEEVRHAAMEAIGWRLRKRGGPADTLLRGLTHRDPITQLLAAEGVARAGRDEGLSILLAAIDLQEDFALRQRAVQALGELGDRRAYDLLLKIVNDPEDVLRKSAIEALGRVGKMGKAHEILDLLLNLARGSDHLAEDALRGLRWFDHPDGWELIRRRAVDPNFAFNLSAIELLGHNDDPATRHLVLNLLTGGNGRWIVAKALVSARKLWGEDSLEPDYAAVQNSTTDTEQRDELFRRLQERGDARRMLEILPKLYPEAAGRVQGILLSRQPLPVAEAETVVAGPDALAAGVAAHLLGRAGTARSGPPVAAALGRWWREWDSKRKEEIRRGVKAGTWSGVLAEPLRSLSWAAGKLGVGADTLLAMATTRADNVHDRRLRRDAVAAMISAPVADAMLTALAALTADGDPEIRAMAAEAVVRAKPERGGETASRVLADRVAFDRVARRDGARLVETLRKAGAQAHYQGIAVPHLAAQRDVAGLAAVANNASLPEEVRIGAVEGLAAAASTEAEAELERIGKAVTNPEELRKAAWRGLRRSKRARTKAAADSSFRAHVGHDSGVSSSSAKR